MVRKPTAYLIPVDLITVLHPKKLIASSENKLIVTKSSQEEPVVTARHIDFVFGDQ